VHGGEQRFTSHVLGQVGDVEDVVPALLPAHHLGVLAQLDHAIVVERERELVDLYRPVDGLVDLLAQVIGQPVVQPVGQGQRQAGVGGDAKGEGFHRTWFSVGCQRAPRRHPARGSRISTWSSTSRVWNRGWSAVAGPWTTWPVSSAKTLWCQGHSTQAGPRRPSPPPTSFPSCSGAERWLHVSASTSTCRPCRCTS